MACLVWMGMACSVSAQELQDTVTVAPQQERLLVDEMQQEDIPLQPTPETLAIDSAALAVGQKPAAYATFTPDPIRSMWLAMVCPGAGQIYNRKFWKLPVIYGGFLGCVYALSWNNQMLRDYSQAYLDIMDDDPGTASYMQMLPIGYDITGKEKRFQEIFKNKKNRYRKYRDMSIFAFAGVYLISVIDAYVDAELSAFDIDEDLSLQLKPSVIDGYGVMGQMHGQQSYGLSCVLNF